MCVSVCVSVRRQPEKEAALGVDVASFPKPGNAVRVVWSSSGVPSVPPLLEFPWGPWPCGASLRKIVPLCLPVCSPSLPPVCVCLEGEELRVGCGCGDGDGDQDEGGSLCGKAT